MCIAKSVGMSGHNDATDVRVVQILLNLNLERLTPPRPAKLKPDGLMGDKTIKCIARFETEAMGLASSDRMLAPGDATIAELLAGLAPGPSKEKVNVVMPSAVPARIELFYAPLVTAMKKYDITKPLRMAHFIAQIGHESASLRYTEEIADGSAYEGRADLGNTQSGDGKRYKGRGLIQLTGRANYTDYSRDTGVDYVVRPDLVARDANVAADVACWFWSKNKLNKLADRDDVKAVTKVVNGGYNGLDDRIGYLGRAKAVLGLA